MRKKILSLILIVSITINLAFIFNRIKADDSRVEASIVFRTINNLQEYQWIEEDNRFNFKEFKKLLNEHNFKLVENTFSHDGETTSINKRFYFHEKETYQYFIKSKNSEIFLINNNGVFKKIDI